MTYEEIYKLYPSVCKRETPGSHPFDQRGFETGDGWVDIIHDLAKVFAEEGNSFHQVKEKFGILRVYPADWENPRTEQAIIDAEKRSSTTCYNCGSVGSLRNEGWLSVRCDSCYEKWMGR